jgi:uncharacterized YigZ family protein|tara:strand:- start:87 stop:689 length:603 start_codon:yes stop_codon:yes gene_type:complete
MLESYKSLKTEATGIYKEKGSKFIAYSYPIIDETDFKNKLSILKKKHHDARHFCYAYRLLANGSNYRLNDDGEPNNSAGKPILGQIDSRSLTHVSVVVVRYFGGTKLGVGGLIKAYKEAAKDSIANNKIIIKEIKTTYLIDFNYSDMSFIMDLAKKLNLTILKKVLEISCQFTIECPLKDKEEFEHKIKNKLLNFKPIES